MNEINLPFHPRVDDQAKRRTNVTRADGRVHVPYDYTDDIVLAVNAALSTDRPLLLRGAPGCGKSTLARDVALALDREFDEKVVTSRTTATDLLWTFDAVRRLSDATPNPDRARDPNNYLHRGVLWNAFAPKVRTDKGIVVLLDEVDKADPDVPNDLLVPLGEGRFLVTDGDPPYEVRRERPVLVVLTTNGERELPPAFLRRCASLTLEDPSANPKRLERIALTHAEASARERNQPAQVLAPALLTKLVERVSELTSSLTHASRRAGTAEILDALKACVELRIQPGDDVNWKTMTRVLLHKETGNPDGAVR